MTTTLKEKIVLGVISALLGGALGNVVEALRTAPRLEAVEKALVRIETRLDAMTRMPARAEAP